MAEFEGNIEIEYYTDLWGPYFFIFPVNSEETANDGIIPYGDTITSVSVRAFIGNVKRKSDLDNFTEITTSMVDPDYTPQISGGNTVLVKIQYPGEDYKGTKVTLILEVDLASGGKKAFYFQYVRVR